MSTGQVIDKAQGKIDRLTDAYTDRALDLADYKRRRADMEAEVERAQHRLAELEAAPAQEPAAPVVRSFADTWPTLSVEVRRDVATALLTGVRVCQDKSVELLPRWGEPVTITFTKRHRTCAAGQLRRKVMRERASVVGRPPDQHLPYRWRAASSRSARGVIGRPGPRR